MALTKQKLFSLWTSLLIFTSCQSSQLHPQNTQGSLSRSFQKSGKDRSLANENPDPYREFRYQTDGRVVAIGDLHGDFEATQRVLRLAGAIDNHNHWIGGTLVLVQTGDQIDRWHDDRKILDLFSDLQTQAEAAGGKVIPLNGNHEFMNVFLDFRFVTPESFRKFLDINVPIQSQLLPKPTLNEDGRYGSKTVMKPRGLGVSERVVAFMPGGPYAKLLATRPFFTIVNDTVFVHGGITPQSVKYGLVKLHEEMRDWMLGKSSSSGIPSLFQELADTHPSWSRLYSDGTPSDEVCKELKEVLATLAVKRMVVGHTPQLEGMNSVCDGLVWRIDIGLSQGFFPVLAPVQPRVFEIANNEIKILRKESSAPRPKRKRSQDQTDDDVLRSKLRK